MFPHYSQSREDLTSQGKIVNRKILDDRYQILQTIGNGRFAK